MMMSEVTRYDITGDAATGAIDITPVPAYMEGRFVSYEDYASLKAERDALADKLARSEDYCIGVDTERMEFIDKSNALAAENLALKSFIEDECYTLGDGLKYDGLLHAATRSMPITPATEAYANQLRAEGVEMFAKHFNCADISDDILEFAANLRKENANG